MKCLGLFARYPEPGRTKTRLAAGVGDTAARELYECFVCDLVERCAGLADRLVIAATPDTPAARSWFESLRSVGDDCSRLEIIFQPSGDLGTRMNWFFERQAEQGSRATILLGTDSPDLPSERIVDAFDALQTPGTDVVISPAADGGFVLVGMTSAPQEIFDGVRWSAPSTLVDTLRSAGRSGLRVTILETWYDIDELENLGTLLALQQNPGRTSAAKCPRTLARLDRLPTDIFRALE